MSRTCLPGRNIRRGREKNISVKIKAAVCAAGVLGFFIMLYCVRSGCAAGFDDPVRYFFYGMRNDILTPVVKAVTYLGNWQSIVIICLILLVLRPTRLIYGVPVSAGAAFVTVLNKLIKNLVQRPRPDDIVHLVSEGGFSFPSGHSITSMFVFGILIYLVRTNVRNRAAANTLTAILAIPMICIGISRIYLGVHYPTDVLAGWFLGIATIAGAVLLIDKLRADIPAARR